MAIRGVPLVPSTVTRTLICVDGIESYDMVGTLLNPYMPEPIKFCSIHGIVSAMEDFFDKISFPQPIYEDRTFSHRQKPVGMKREESEVRQYMSEDIFVDEQGKKATFVVQVQFRQNATWQGTITWTEEKKTQRFRSTLEMIKLMDSALSECENGTPTSNSMW